MFLEFLWLLLFMVLFSLLAVWLRAVLDVWQKGGEFRFQIFIYENTTRLILCAIGDVLLATLYFFEPKATHAVFEYLGFGWAAAAGAALGFAVALFTVVFKTAAQHPLR